MRLNIAIIEVSNGWTLLKDDIYKACLYWFEKAGHTVSLTYNEMLPSCPNIILGNYYLKPDHILAILESGLSYGLLETEIVGTEGHNNSKDPMAFEMHRRLYENARVILTAIPDNIEAFSRMGFLAHLIQLGYCPLLETTGPLPDEFQDIDLFFFGNLDERRIRLLDELGRKYSVKTMGENPALPHTVRNALASRAKIVLSLRRGEPYTHLGSSRIWHLAHNRIMTLSEPPGDGDDTMDGLCQFQTYEAFDETISYLLENPKERISQGEAFFEKVKSIRTEEVIGHAMAHYR